MIPLAAQFLLCAIRSDPPQAGREPDPEQAQPEREEPLPSEVAATASPDQATAEIADPLAADPVTGDDGDSDHPSNGTDGGDSE